MTLALLSTAQHVSDVNTSIFRSLRLLGALLCRLYCAVMTEVYVLIYLSSGKCYTYIICCVWLCVSVFLQACGVLWFLNILCVVCFGVLYICIDVCMHELYIPDLRLAGVMWRDWLLVMWYPSAILNIFKYFTVILIVSLLLPQLYNSL